MTATPNMDGADGVGTKSARNRLRYLRLRSRLTQKELGKLVDLDHTTISHHENGTRTMTGEQISKYATVFKCETYELFQEPVSEPEYEEVDLTP